MSQSWEFISLTALQTLESVETLDEVLWMDTTSLVEVLWKPPLPPSPITSDVLARNRKRLAVTVAASAASNIDSDVTSASPLPSTLTQPTMTSPFTQLPPEIVVYIFSHIPDLTDALCLGLTNTLVWACGELHIHALFYDLHAPWAGHSIICLGESAKTLPSGVCSEQQLLRYATALSEPQFFNINKTSRKGDPHQQKPSHTQAQASHRDTSRPVSVSAGYLSRSELDFSSQQITKFVHNILYERSYYHRPARILEKERHEFPKRARISRRARDAGVVAWTHPSREQKFRQVPPASSQSPNNDGDGDSEERMIMLLRNLTRKLYLRSDTLPVTGDDPFYGFGPALIRRICWTDPTTCSAWYESAVCEGAWAGDRFDVIPVSTSVSDSNPGSTPMGGNGGGRGGRGELSVKKLDESGWEDVTGVLKEEMITSWELHLGPDWKNWAW